MGRWPEINSCGPAESTEGKVVRLVNLHKAIKKASYGLTDANWALAVLIKAVFSTVLAVDLELKA